MQSLLTQQSLLIQQLHPIASSTTVGRQTTGTATLLSRNLLYGWKERTGDNNAQYLKYPEMYKVFSFWRKHLAARYQWRVHKAMWHLIYALKMWHSIQGWRQCIFSHACKTINKGTDFNKKLKACLGSSEESYIGSNIRKWVYAGRCSRM